MIFLLILDYVTGWNLDFVVLSWFFSIFFWGLFIHMVTILLLQGYFVLILTVESSYVVFISHIQRHWAGAIFFYFIIKFD